MGKAEPRVYLVGLVPPTWQEMRRPRSTQKRPLKRRRTQEERSTKTTAKIMAAARDCIFERGYAGATMSAIARRAGVTRGALQHHFGSRLELFKALIDYFFASLPDLKSPSSGQRAVEDVRDFVLASFQVYGTRIGLAILDIRIGSRGEPRLHAELEKKFRATDPVRENVWRELFERSGLSTAQAETLREVTYAILRGLAVRQGYINSRYSADSEINVVLDMLVSYLAKTKRNRSNDP